MEEKILDNVENIAIGGILGGVPAVASVVALVIETSPVWAVAAVVAVAAGLFMIFKKKNKSYKKHIIYNIGDLFNERRDVRES